MIKYNRLLEILKIPRNSSREEIIAKLIEVRNDNTNIAVDMGFEIKTSEGYPGLDYDLDSEFLKKYISSYKIPITEKSQMLFLFMLDQNVDY